jgi:MFS transporter, NNP family, nitrate/nitrite transporter
MAVVATKRSLDQAVHGSASASSRLMTAMAILGFAVNTGAWVMICVLGQQLGQRYGLGPAGQAVLIAVPLAVGSVGRIPVGALTDRYGARLMFPAVSLAAGMSVVLLAYVSSVLSLIAVAVALGIAGTAFAIGASMVARCGRPNRRGSRLSVFGAGIGGAAVAVLMARPVLDHTALRASALWVAAVLAGYAVLAAVVIRDAPVPVRRGSLPHDVLAVLRLPATRQWCLLYGVACGPMFAIAIYLPTYLHAAYQRPWPEAAIATAVLLGVAAAFRPVGGWLADHARPVPVLVTCYTSIGVLGLILAFEPSPDVEIGALVGVAAAAGTAGGGLLYLIGKAVPPERAGLILGVVGAVGGASGLVPPTLLGAVYGIDDDFTIGIMLLSGVSMAAATYLRRRRQWIDPLVYPILHTNPAALEPPEVSPSGTTAVALAASDTVRDSAAILAVLAELITRQEVLIVYGHDLPPPAGALSPPALVAAIRDRLPRHNIAAVMVDPASPGASAEYAIMDELLADGSVPVAVVHAVDPADAAESLASRLGADVVRLTHDPAHRVRLQPITTATVDRARSQSGQTCR